MEIIDNIHITYFYRDNYIKESIILLEQKLRKLQDMMNDYDERIQDLYIHIICDQIYVMENEIEKLKQIRKDKLYEVYN